MMTATGVNSETLARSTTVRATFPAWHRARRFGSRATGTPQTCSDIDLALSGDSLDGRSMGRVSDALDDLLLPDRFSLVIYDHNTDAEVAARIARVGLSIFQRPTPPPSRQPIGI